MNITLRKLISTSLSFLLAMLILNVSQVSLAAEKPLIDVIINGRPLSMDVAPILRENRVYIPIKYFAEALDFKVEWIESERTAKLTNLETTILIPIGVKEVTLNDKKVILDEKSFIEKGRTFIPLRAVAEILSQNVDWDQKNKIAIVGEFTSKKDIEGSLENKYIFRSQNRGFEIKIPNTLKDRLVIKEKNGVVSFYDKYNYDNEEMGGNLFNISKKEDFIIEILDSMPSNVLKYDNGIYYIVIFASDVQFIPGDKKSTDSYMETLKLSESFLPSFDLKGLKDSAGKNYERISKYMKAESIAAWSKYYELLDFQISNYEEKLVDGNLEATFLYKIIEKNFDKDPDTVAYIKEAKESGDKYYQRYYDEYLQPRESNYDLKIIIDKDDVITLYSNVSPNGIEWKKMKMTDYIIKE